MNITRKSILGFGMDTSLVNIGWLRPYKPNKRDTKEKMIDSVEFEINHRGIEKLERNIHDETEYIMCFVHFESGTEKLDGIYMYIHDEDATIDNSIDTNILCEDEKKIIIEYALEELRDYRE